VNGGTLNHEDWLNKMRDVTRLADEHEETATLRLRELLNETETAKKSAVTSWHSRQCLELLAQIESETGDLESAAQIDERAAEETEQELRELQTASAFRFATAALFRFKLGHTDRAMALAKKALSLADSFVDPSEVFERLIHEVRQVRNAQPAEGA